MKKKHNNNFRAIFFCRVTNLCYHWFCGNVWSSDSQLEAEKSWDGERLKVAIIIIHYF